MKCIDLADEDGEVLENIIHSEYDVASTLPAIWWRDWVNQQIHVMLK
jgi:hypothetical protein